MQKNGDLLRQKKIKPVVDRVFPMAEVKYAHEYLESEGQFGKVIENLSEIRRTDKVFQRFYSEAYEMNIEYNPESPLSILSSFNSYFIFQRV